MRDVGRKVDLWIEIVMFIQIRTGLGDQVEFVLLF
jgi:hypothetical protein